MRVDFSVPEQQLPLLKIGQPVRLGAGGDDLPFTGTIRGIDPKIDPASRLVAVAGGGRQSRGQAEPGSVRAGACRTARGKERAGAAADRARRAASTATSSSWCATLRLPSPPPQRRPRSPVPKRAEAAAPAAGGDKPELVAGAGLRQDRPPLDGMVEISAGHRRRRRSRHRRAEPAVQRRCRSTSTTPSTRPSRRNRAGGRRNELLRYLHPPARSCRPSLACMILLLGFQGIFNLSIRQYPKVEETVITITTVYPGASADLIQGFITAPIAARRRRRPRTSTTSRRRAGRPSSTVTVQMKLGSNPDVALTEVLSKVQQRARQLADDGQGPGDRQGHRPAVRDDVSVDAESEHDAGAADRIYRARHPAAHVDDRGRRRRADPRRGRTTRCASGSIRSSWPRAA